MLSSNFHPSTLFQHFGEQYIKFIVTYCNTKRGKRNIWLLLIVSWNSQVIGIDNFCRIFFLSLFHVDDLQEPFIVQETLLSSAVKLLESSFAFFQPRLDNHSLFAEYNIQPTRDIWPVILNCFLFSFPLFLPWFPFHSFFPMTILRRLQIDSP